MGFFGRGKKDRVLDLSEKYLKEQERAAEMAGKREDTGSENATGFLGDLASGVNSEESSGYVDVGIGDERRKKLAKRLMEMTDKLENLSNQLYHLQQRVEVLERKVGVSFSG